MSCEITEREGGITLMFSGCTEHAEFRVSDAHANIPGVDPEMFYDGILMTLEEVMTTHLEKNPDVQAYINTEGDFYGSDGPRKTLSERAQKHLLRLLANQLLVRQVTTRRYGMDVSSASLSLPWGV